MFIIGMVIFWLSVIGFQIALGLWTYADAKVKSNHNPALWVLLVLLLNFPVGLIIYLVAGREKTEKSPGKFKKFLIVSSVCFVLSIFLLIFVLNFMGTT